MVQTHDFFQDVKQKWSTHERQLHNKLWDEHGHILGAVQNTLRHIVVGSLAALLSISQPAATSIIAEGLQSDQSVSEPVPHSKDELVTALGTVLPPEVIPLTPEQDEVVGATLSEYFGLQVSASLEGKRLNRDYGYIGAEQHLMRYPGDTIGSHFSNEQEMNDFGPSGMAPGRGAWGYFAPSFEDMTQTEVEREKYYLAVQTFLSPGWGERTNELYNFFKFRKMLVVNPENGKAMVVVIGDAGPAEWTGKHLGGSPEVMRYLERVDGGGKGPVLYFFINDPDNAIPLGPITVK